MYRWFLIVICLMLVFSCACAPSEIATLEATSSTPTASPTNTPTATPEPTNAATPTIAPTATASPKPTIKIIDSTPMIVKGKEKVKADVNQRFEDFLNGTGEFTEERIENEAFMVYDGKTDLGCVSASDEYAGARIQGIILYYIKTNNGEIFAFGTKNKDKKRIITLVEYPSQAFVKIGEYITFQINFDRSFYSDANIRQFGRNNYYYEFLDSYIGSFSEISVPICLSFNNPSYPEYSDVWKKIAPEVFDPKIAANQALMTNINIVDKTFVNNVALIKEFYYSKPAPILTIENFDDFEQKIESSYNQIPCCDMFTFISHY